MHKRVEETIENARYKTRQILRHLGYANVRTSANAEEARATFKEFDPHLAVVDIMLPEDEDGFDLIKEMRDADPRMHIIAVSALESSDYKSFGIRAGADDYIAKTATITELSDRLERHLKRIPLDMAEPVVRWRNISEEGRTYRGAFARKDGRSSGGISHPASS